MIGRPNVLGGRSMCMPGAIDKVDQQQIRKVRREEGPQRGRKSPNIQG